jgi:hypothetical protein
MTGFSIRIKISLLIISIVLFSLFLVSLLNYFNFQKNYEGLRKSGFMVVSADLKNNIEYGLNLGLSLVEIKNIQGVIDEAKWRQKEIISADVLDESGIIQYSTEPKKLNTPATEEWRRAMKLTSAAAPPFIKTKTECTLLRPLSNSFGQEAGILAITYRRWPEPNPVYAMGRILTGYFIAAGSISVLLVIASVWFLSRGIKRTFKAMDICLHSSASGEGEITLNSEIAEQVCRFKQAYHQAIAQITEIKNALKREN